ncbi:zinc ribbon domain-containing protein [Streptomyces erythrochromogenes]
MCGVVDGEKPLHVRTWRCGACGTEHDRDLDASRVTLPAGQSTDGPAAIPALQRREDVKIPLPPGW